MNDFSQKNFDAFFSAISAWRPAYQRARLHFLGVRTNGALSIIAARIYLNLGGTEPVRPPFRAGNLEAGQWEIPQHESSVESTLQALVGSEGLVLDGFGRLKLVSDERHEVFIAPPTLPTFSPSGCSNVGGAMKTS